MRTRALLVGALLASLVVACEGIQNGVIERGAASRASVDPAAAFAEDGLHVVLCGTGSPLPDPNRAGPCTAVLAGGMMVVVDSGPGSTENLNLWNMPYAQLEAVLLTHFHSDHIGELGELNMQSWVGSGRSRSLKVYGPPGVHRVVAGFSTAYSLDNGYRVAHHGADIIPPTGGEMRAIPFDPPADGSPVVVFEKGGLRVTAALVDHHPVAPAVGYRFDYKGRSVAISGDTDVSEDFVKLSQGVDLMVHEVLVKDVLQTLSRVAGESGRPRVKKLAADVIDYHTSPREAVDVAKRAGANTIVFSHMVPPLPGILSDSVFLRGVEDEGEVDVVLGEDGMHFMLPAGADSIDQRSL